jgi:hypothetical protein
MMPEALAMHLTSSLHNEVMLSHHLNRQLLANIDIDSVWFYLFPVEHKHLLQVNGVLRLSESNYTRFDPGYSFQQSQLNKKPGIIGMGFKQLDLPGNGNLLLQFAYCFSNFHFRTVHTEIQC